MSENNGHQHEEKTNEEQDLQEKVEAKKSDVVGAYENLEMKHGQVTYMASNVIGEMHRIQELDKIRQQVNAPHKLMVDLDELYGHFTADQTNEENLRMAGIVVDTCAFLGVVLGDNLRYYFNSIESIIHPPRIPEDEEEG